MWSPSRENRTHFVNAAVAGANSTSGPPPSVNFRAFLLQSSLRKTWNDLADMNPTCTEEVRGRRTPQRSRYGCRNCKLRKVKVSSFRLPKFIVKSGLWLTASLRLPYSVIRANRCAKDAPRSACCATFCPMSPTSSPSPPTRGGHPRFEDGHTGSSRISRTLSGHLTHRRPIN